MVAGLGMGERPDGGTLWDRDRIFLVLHEGGNPGRAFLHLRREFAPSGRPDPDFVGSDGCGMDCYYLNELRRVGFPSSPGALPPAVSATLSRHRQAHEKPPQSKASH